LCYAPSRCLRAFPTRRSSDLEFVRGQREFAGFLGGLQGAHLGESAAHAEESLARALLGRAPGDLDVGLGLRKAGGGLAHAGVDRDRKSTRLNSSHVKISYAVF